MNRFSIPELYQKVFGIKGVRFDVDGVNKLRESQPDSFNLELNDRSKAMAFSFLGTPINEQISFSLPGIENVYTFPDWPLIEISASKNILTTPMRGRNGSIKEYINTDDYRITIRGIFINHISDEYPEDLVLEFHNLFKINSEIRVTNSLLNLLDVHDLVITNLRLPEVEGFNHIQPFVIECLSDRTYEVSIVEAKNQKINLPR